MLSPCLLLVVLRQLLPAVGVCPARLVSSSHKPHVAALLKYRTQPCIGLWHAVVQLERLGFLRLLPSVFESFFAASLPSSGTHALPDRFIVMCWAIDQECWQTMATSTAFHATPPSCSRSSLALAR